LYKNQLNDDPGVEMNKLIRNLFAIAIIAGVGTLSAEEAATGLVVTTEALPERCILGVVITQVDGEDIAEDSDGRFELEAGSHTFSGYGVISEEGEEIELCATFADNSVTVSPGDELGKGSMSVDVTAGKEYYLGLDVRRADKSTWKIVAWKIKH